MYTARMTLASQSRCGVWCAAMTPAKPKIHPLAKLAVDIGPLVVFFLANAQAGIFWATGAFMVAICIAIAVSWLFERRVPMLAVVTGVFVLIFGSLTLVLQDETFIKLKPTIVNALFAAILTIGLAANRLFFKNLFGHAFRLNDAGWRILTLRWIGFFILLAVLNEVVWRNFSTDTWITFKLFGIMPLTFVFTMLQIPLIKRHHVAEEESSTP